MYDRIQFKGHEGLIRFNTEGTGSFEKIEGIDDLVFFKGESMTKLQKNILRSGDA